MLTTLVETVVLVLVVGLVVVPEPEAEKRADAAFAQPAVVSAISVRMSAANR